MVGSTFTFDVSEGDVWLIKTTPEVNKLGKNDDVITLYYFLQQNYPNPFNSTTTINYRIKKSGHIRILLFDLTGKEIEVIFDQYQMPGDFHFQWDSRDLASGIYFYSLIIDDKAVATKKTVLIK